MEMPSVVVLLQQPYVPLQFASTTNVCMIIIQWDFKTFYVNIKKVIMLLYNKTLRIYLETKRVPTASENEPHASLRKPPPSNHKAFPAVYLAIPTCNVSING